MKKRINFKQIEVAINYDGDKATVDASKELAAIIFNTAINYDDFELGRIIHQNGEVEIDINQAEIIKKYAASGTLTYFALAAIREALDILFQESAE